MGMFDLVDFACACPICGALVDGFQTKDLESILSLVPPTMTLNFYSSCPKCKSWIEFNKDEPYTLYIAPRDIRSGHFREGTTQKYSEEEFKILLVTYLLERP